MSPSERYAVVSFYSGQSEEAYQLFDISAGLARIGGIPYQFGEAASYCFSEDEQVLVMALPTTCSEWWWLIEDAEPDRARAERLAFTFGTIVVHDVVDNTISVHAIRVCVPLGWTPQQRSYDPELRPTFLPGNRLQLSMPWGGVDLAMPLPPSIALYVPR